MCEAIGARLCSKYEAVNKIAARTGCNQDGKWMWTGTVCGTGIDGDKYYIVKTNKARVKCKNPNRVKGVRCCADV
jgi:hypothetical protein